MATTNKGIYYPTASDSITPLHTVFNGVADSVENVASITGEQLFTGPSATGGVVTVNVNFPITFTTPPKVVASVRAPGGTSVYAVTITGTPSTTAFSARVFRCNGSTAETNLQLVWIANTYA